MLRHVSVNTVIRGEVNGVLVLHEPGTDHGIACKTHDPGVDAERKSNGDGKIYLLFRDKEDRCSKK